MKKVLVIVSILFAIFFSCQANAQTGQGYQGGISGGWDGYPCSAAYTGNITISYNSDGDDHTVSVHGSVTVVFFGPDCPLDGISETITFRGDGDGVTGADDKSKLFIIENPEFEVAILDEIRNH